MFTPSNMLQKYLNTNPRDNYDIIGALMGYINADPQFKTDGFKQAIKYVFDCGVPKEDIFAEFNPEYELIEEPSMWDEDYYSLARVYLKDNFCEKRIHHVEEVACKIYGTHASKNTVIGSGELSTYGANDDIGGNKSSEKKSQNQQQAEENRPTVKTLGLIISVAFVLLVIVIAVIFIGL